MSHFDQSMIDRQINEWLNTLDDLLEENIVLKHRLSDIIIGQQHTQAGLDVMEAFQNSFVNKDAHIMLLWQDIKAQQKLAGALKAEGGTYYNFSHKQKRLQYDVMMMVEQFNRLKKTFELQFALVSEACDSVPGEAN
jgi:hypothetical protein